MADTQSNFKVILDGTVANVTPGTAVQFNGGTALGCRRVLVTALPGNTGVIAVGASTVKATVGVSRGVTLSPGQSIELPVADVSMLYMDAVYAADAVSWLAFKTTE
jgi:hypothetical protein